MKIYFMKSCGWIKPFLVIVGWLVANTSSIRGPYKPDRCSPNANILYKFCCIIPPFFTREVSMDCGGAFEMVLNNEKQGLIGLKRLAINCGYWYCVLDKYALITPDGYLDQDKYYIHLDSWAKLNPAYADVMTDAKISCKQDYRYYMPLKICEFFKLHMCIRNYLNVECAVPVPTKECDEQRAFYKDCGSYFH